MKLKFERTARAARDIVVIEQDGTICSAFNRTGYLKSMNRTRFSAGSNPSSAGLSVTDGTRSDAGSAHDAPYGLVFVSEIDGVEKLALVERFARFEDAHAALALIQRAMKRHWIRAGLLRGWRAGILWVLAPLFAATVSMALVRYLDSHNGAVDALNVMMRSAAAESTAPAPTVQSRPTEPSLLPSTAPVTRPALSPDMTAIHFGLENQPARKTLYVYSDPNCPACRRFEPHLDALSKDFSIYVLPVAYQSGSDELARAILCASNKAAKWADVMKTTATNAVGTGEQCSQADAGLRANMQAFDAMGFTQTPRVVSGTGYVFAAGATAADILSQSALH